MKAEPQLLQFGSEIAMALVLGVEPGDEAVRLVAPPLKTIQLFDQFGITGRIRISVLRFVAHNLINARPEYLHDPIYLPVPV
jgi:hypothetical protein